MPNLEITQFEENQEGLVNDIVIINHQYVFRFAKTEESARILDTEIKILDLVRPQMGIAVPKPIYKDQNCMVYPFLSGQSLTRMAFLELEDRAQQRIAEQLGEFLSGLHTTQIARVNWDIPATLAPVTREKWLEIYQKAEEKVYPLLLKHQVEWAENLFKSALGDDRFFNYEPTLIHGDLASYHILFDP